METDERPGTNQNPPAHWIGVEAGWEERGGDPLASLVSLPAWRLATHALVLGATGSGKTNLLHHLVAQAAMERRSLVVLDLRGDLAAACLEILAAAGTDPKLVEVLDLREKARPTGFAPLRGRGEPYFAALGVLDAVEAEHGELGVQLGETLRYGLMLLAEAGQPLTRLEALFHDRAFLLGCLGNCRSEPVAAFWGRLDAMSPEKRQALSMPVLNKVSMLFATEGLRRTFGHPTPIDLGRHLDAPGSVLLVSLAADELHAAGRMAGRMVLSSVCREVFSRVNVPEARRNRVLLVVDEFEHFAGRDFEAILAEGRRFGLSLVAAHQTLAQLSPRMRSLILGNVGAKLAFRLGREDAATMSKDLTGDPRALDLASLPTGQCVLWTRDGAVTRVEVNAPIARGGGPPSRRGAALLEAVRSRSVHAIVVPPPVTSETTVPSAEFATRKRATVRPPTPVDEAPSPTRRPQPTPRTDLEDWLS